MFDRNHVKSVYGLLQRYGVLNSRVAQVTHSYGGTDVTSVCFYLSRAHEILTHVTSVPPLSLAFQFQNKSINIARV